MDTTLPAVSRVPAEFRQAVRHLTSVLAPIEKRCLLWIAARLPAWVSSDQLTALALVAMAAAGASYWIARVTPVGLWLAIACLAVNWFGDSLDGTLARVRRHERPRFGFYVDHVVDGLGACLLLGGLALSGYMQPLIALGLLAAYLLVCVEVYLATYCLGTFTISFWKIGPTELRILLAIGTAALAVHPTAEVFGRPYRIFDIGGGVGIVGLAVTMLSTAARNTRTLFLAEPIPRDRR